MDKKLHSSNWVASKEGVIYIVLKNGKQKKLRQHKNRYGYFYVRITINGKRTLVMVHKLVAVQFLGERPEKSEIRHLNGIKTDNRLENLAWGTKLENAADKKLHGQTSKGAKHSEAIKNSPQFKSYQERRRIL